MRRPGLALAIGAGVVYLVLVGTQLNRPLMYDDANFALAAKAVAETGLPFGNQGWMSERSDFSQREQWALWHPPLYVYLEGLAARLGGWTPPVLRLAGVLGGLATAALSYVLAKDLTRGLPAMRERAGGVAAALVLVCPLVIQSALILDIDFPLLLPLTLVFLFLYLRLENSHTAWLWLAPLFAVLLWAKMTNPLPLVAVAAVWQMLRGNFGRGVLHLVGIGFGGVALFGISWLAVGSWLGFPLDMPLSVNLVQWQSSADVARRAYATFGAFIEGLQPTVVWLGPGLVALGLASIAVRGGQLARSWQLRGVDLLTGVVIVLVLGYVNKDAGWFPKYQVALAPLLACLAAPLAAEAWRSRPRLTMGLAVLAAATAGAIGYRLIRDDWALERTWAIDPTAAGWLLLALVVATLLGLALRASAASAWAGLIGLAIGWSMATDLIQRTAPYHTGYWYGTSGTREAADWVDGHLRPDQLYLASKEVAVRSHDLRYVDQENVAYFLSLGQGFDGTWAGEPLQALVIWQREPYIAGLFGRALPSAGFREAERLGDYVIYVPLSAS